MEDQFDFQSGMTLPSFTMIHRPEAKQPAGWAALLECEPGADIAAACMFIWANLALDMNGISDADYRRGQEVVTRIMAEVAA
ncbi:hypothetical protein [Rhizobium leguminosarum]|uniref:hypothetical protein n=1 Tax=Rhizobium leguminosarum TaxID=384 RepID=UPI003F9CC1BE